MSLLTRPMVVGSRTYPPLALAVLAAVGAAVLLVVAIDRWRTPSDEFAYWLAAQRLATGQAVYDPTAQPGTPYAYFYPPPLAQLLAPIASIVPDGVFVAAWTVLLLGCLLWLSDRRPLVMLAFVAFIPVAVELWYRNIHLVLAVMIVLGLRRSAAWFALAAAIKIAPALGILYFIAARRWRDAAVACGVGLALLIVSVLASPGAWQGFIDNVAVRGPTVGASLVPIPFAIRAVAGALLALVAGYLAWRSTDDRPAEAILVMAIVIANPTLWATVFSVLIALVPLWRSASFGTSAGHSMSPDRGVAASAPGP